MIINRRDSLKFISDVPVYYRSYRRPDKKSCVHWILKARMKFNPNIKVITNIIPASDFLFCRDSDNQAYHGVRWLSDGYPPLNSITKIEEDYLQEIRQL